ncbi:MAG TPA: isoleucine--tRNA ligase [Candidatus Acidoferrales bacterium]|jgi:isoleucyl-tRNA synthetase|nr:isoleucine--tRNA ligase [Candidatus Acidoferrales bacterium]
MAKTIDLKSTLNLPKTDFPMKARLPEREPEQLAAWEGSGLYRRILESREGAPLFVLHDGPPYPTGEIHLGTGLNKVLKDMIVKSKTMTGFRSPYIPGWDCHGLPIETQVEKKLGGKTTKVDAAQFRRMCREFAAGYVEIHKREFRRLGIFGQWDKPYLTMDPSMEASIAGAFLDFLEKGYVYRGLKPVYWCLHDRTALAEAEVEYDEHVSPSVWVRYPVVGYPGTYAIVWTTTPWTLPASMALAFGKDIRYVRVVDSKGDHYLFAKDLAGRIAKSTGLEFREDFQPLEGIRNLKFTHPFLDRELPAVFGDHVTLEQGSGIVHTAPGHGIEDYRAGQEYGLKVYAPIDDDGRFTEGLPEYKGKSVFEANPFIIDLLKRHGALLAQEKISHSYPHCWRCHNPVIFRATEQWFIQMDAGSDAVPAPKAPPLRKTALAQIEKVKWLPAWGRDRMRGMIADRPDWTISRQRFWGVPLIVFRCEGCGQRNNLTDPAALRHVLPFFEREGSDAWYTHTAEELLPSGTKCACGSAKLQKENDILDVWFESGSTHLSVLTEANGLHWPAQVYLEGPDQFRGWFQSSLLVGIGTRGGAPYEQVVTHGWTLDENGKPMSKSEGNALYPKEIVDKWGADLLRQWVVSQDYTADMRNSPAMMTQLSEAYRKIRNTFRFALSNLFDFDPASDALADADLWEVDAWMLRRTAQLVRECRERYANFEFHRVYHAIHDFCTVDLSAFYFDMLKDRLYTFAPKNRGRRSAQTAVYRIASALARLIAPILVFTAEEIWKFLPRAASEAASVHMAMFPAAEELERALDSERSANWDRLLGVREEVLKALEPMRAQKTISANLEARVTLTASGGLATLLQRYAASLPAFFIVSQVEVETVPANGESSTPGASGPGMLAIRAERALGSKCERCWNYSTHVGESADYPTFCERCVAALNEIEGEGGAAAGNAKP